MLRQGAARSAQSVGECRAEGRYFLSSRLPKVSEFVTSVLSHWSVESMHWVLDVVFHEDASRIRTKHATANFCFCLPLRDDVTQAGHF